MAEKDIEIETVQVDLSSGEQFSDAYRKLNPDCVVPALELDDGSCITEVLAICDYLESRYPEPSLLGTTDEQRARVLMWNIKVEQQGLLAVADAFRNSSKGFEGRAAPGPVAYPQIPELGERGRGLVEQFYQRIDKHLASSEFLAGEQFSIADISAMVVVDFAAWIKLAIPESAVNAQRWYDSVAARPSAFA